MISILATLAVATSLTTASPAVSADRAQIEHALNVSADGWNERDLEKYMAVYASLEDTSYVSQGNVVRGFAAIRSTYAARFATADTGHLAFKIIEFRQLSPELACVLGEYDLRQGNGVRHSGATTLIFRKMAGAWRIILDHTG